jgi:hypothetical protein
MRKALFLDLYKQGYLLRLVAEGIWIRQPVRVAGVRCESETVGANVPL